jgi:spermidine/putrescine transport system permease protein
VTPEINAISTVIICVSLALLFTSRSLQNRQTGVQESHHA